MKLGAATTTGGTFTLRSTATTTQHGAASVDPSPHNVAAPRLGVEDSDKVAAFLGRRGAGANAAAALGLQSKLGNECERGVHDPVNYGPNEQFTLTLIHLLPYADMTYVVCTNHCDMNIPYELQGRVLMVNGYEIDQCLQLEAQSHWVKASLTHGAAIAHARANGFDRAAVLEEDSTSAPNPFEWEMGNYQELNAFLSGEEQEKWNVIRLGYRPVEHEGSGEKQCSPECQCEAVGAVLCYMRSTGCQLHSSDAYIMRSTMFDWVLRSVSLGTIIDYGLLQSIPNQLIITPQINYQTAYADSNDATDVNTQLAAGAAFQRACMPSST